VAGNPVIQQLLAARNLFSALRTQRPVHKALLRGEDQITWRTGDAGIIAGSSGLLRVSGTNLDVLNEIADLTELGTPAICFEPECPAGSDGLTIGVLDDVPPTTDEQLSDFRVQTTDTYDRRKGGSWIDGRVAYAEGFGAPSTQLTSTAVGIGRATSLVDFSGDIPTGTSHLWIQVLRGPDPIQYSIQCGQTRLNVFPPPTLGAYVWAWEWAGPLDLQGSGSPCSLGMRGRLGAVAGGVLTSRFPWEGTLPGFPRILVSPAAAAHSWRRAQGASFNYPGVTSTAAILRDGGSLTFALPSLSSSRHVFAHVFGISGNVRVRARGMEPDPDRIVVHRDESAWLDLGNLPLSASRVTLRVKGGTVAVNRIAITTPADLAVLNTAGSSEVPLVLDGNVRMQGAGEVRVERLLSTDQPTYLIVRSSAGPYWQLDGRSADGTYAGYGQLYRMIRNQSALTSFLRARAAIGAGLTLLFTLALLVLGAEPWWRHKLTRVGQHAGAHRKTQESQGHWLAGLRQWQVQHRRGRHAIGRRRSKR
jgi:hypothetical protein